MDIVIFINPEITMFYKLFFCKKFAELQNYE